MKDLCLELTKHTTIPYFGAVVPCVGFYLSTQSINLVKKGEII